MRGQMRERARYIQQVVSCALQLLVAERSLLPLLQARCSLAAPKVMHACVLRRPTLAPKTELVFGDTLWRHALLAFSTLFFFSGQALA